MEIWLCVFQKVGEKMREQDILEKLCDRTVEAVHEKFIRKFYFVKISHLKLGHIFLIVRKKGEDCLVWKKMLYIEKHVKLLVVFLSGASKNTHFCLIDIFSSLNC